MRVKISKYHNYRQITSLHFFKSWLVEAYYYVDFNFNKHEPHIYINWTGHPPDMSSQQFLAGIELITSGSLPWQNKFLLSALDHSVIMAVPKFGQKVSCLSVFLLTCPIHKNTIHYTWMRFPHPPCTLRTPWQSHSSYRQAVESACYPDLPAYVACSPWNVK